MLFYLEDLINSTNIFYKFQLILDVQSKGNTKSYQVFQNYEFFNISEMSIDVMSNSLDFKVKEF